MSEPKPGPRRSLRRRIHVLLLSRHTHPHQLALGVALGVFVGVSPFYLLHTLLAAGLAWMLRLNIAAAILGTQISNPFLAPGVIAASLWIGNALGPGNASHGAWDPLGAAFYLSWLRGGVVLGLGLAIALGSLTWGAALLARRRQQA